MERTLVAPRRKLVCTGAQSASHTRKRGAARRSKQRRRRGSRGAVWREAEGFSRQRLENQCRRRWSSGISACCVGGPKLHRNAMRSPGSRRAVVHARGELGGGIQHGDHKGVRVRPMDSKGIAERFPWVSRGRSPLAEREAAPRKAAVVRARNKSVVLTPPLRGGSLSTSAAPTPFGARHLQNVGWTMVTGLSGWTSSRPLFGPARQPRSHSRTGACPLGLHGRWPAPPDAPPNLRGVRCHRPRPAAWPLRLLPQVQPSATGSAAHRAAASPRASWTWGSQARAGAVRYRHVARLGPGFCGEVGPPNNPLVRTPTRPCVRTGVGAPFLPRRFPTTVGPRSPG